MGYIYENIVKTMNRISPKAMLIRIADLNNPSNFNIDQDYFLCIILNTLFYAVLHVRYKF